MPNDPTAVSKELLLFGFPAKHNLIGFVQSYLETRIKKNLDLSDWAGLAHENFFLSLYLI